jgi:hypothetical protein
MVANRSMRATAASGAMRCGWRSRAISPRQRGQASVRRSAMLCPHGRAAASRSHAGWNRHRPARGRSRRVSDQPRGRPSADRRLRAVGTGSRPAILTRRRGSLATSYSSLARDQRIEPTFLQRFDEPQQVAQLIVEVCEGQPFGTGNHLCAIAVGEESKDSAACPSGLPRHPSQPADQALHPA